MRYMCDFSRLKRRMLWKGYNVKKLAKLLEISDIQLYRKLNNEYSFKAWEILDICTALEISSDKIGEYFFSTIPEEEVI